MDFSASEVIALWSMASLVFGVLIGKSIHAGSGE